MPIHRLAAASSASHSGDGKADTRTVILVPWIGDDNVMALRAYFPPMQGEDPALYLRLIDTPFDGAIQLARPFCRSKNYEYNSDLHAFILRYKFPENMTEEDWLSKSRFTPNTVKLGTITGAIAVDLPKTHQIFTVARTEFLILEDGLLFFNQGNAPHYRNVTKPLIDMLGNMGLFSMASIRRAREAAKPAP